MEHDLGGDLLRRLRSALLRGGRFPGARLHGRVHPEQFAAKGIEVKIGHRVLSLDAAAQTLRVEHKGDSFTDRYDRLMIRHRCPRTDAPIPGLQQRGVFGLRRMADGLALKGAVQDPRSRKAVVIGSGFIGLEWSRPGPSGQGGTPHRAGGQGHPRGVRQRDHPAHRDRTAGAGGLPCISASGSRLCWGMVG